MYLLLKDLLSYPKKIFIREKDGLFHVRKFTKNNIELGSDIVLQGKGYDLNNIFTKPPCFKHIDILPNSVGIIPNLRVVERTNQGEVYSLYKALMETLINQGKTVYILRHSFEDLEVCEQIKNLFPENEKVLLISEDLSAIELEKIISGFDFVIASRYHSIVHAYRNGVPVLAIGWAAKYREILEDFGQSDYLFDIRKRISVTEIEKSLLRMNKNYETEKLKIFKRLDSPNVGKNIFMVIKECQEKIPNQLS